MSANKTRFEVVAGSRANPGEVLKTFPATKSYKCGGPATACLRWFDAHSEEREMFFRKVTA